MNTNFLCQSIEINEEVIELEGISSDALALQEDLFRDFAEMPTVKFRFERANQSHIKYLTKLLFSTRICNSETSLGGKIEKLRGSYVLINDNFKVAE